MQSTIQSKVEHIAILLHDDRIAVFILHCPRRLYAERCLEIGFGRFQVAQHKYTAPRTHSHTRSELTTAQRDGLSLQRIAHSLFYRIKCIQTDACFRTCANNDLIVMVECILPFSKQVIHSIATCHVRQEPEGMLKNTQQTRIREGHRGLLAKF